MVKINDTVRLLTVGFMLQCAHLCYHENACVFNCTLPIRMIYSAIKWFEFEFEFAWSDYSVDKCIIQTIVAIDMTPPQVSCWKGKSLRQTQGGTLPIYIYMREQSALGTWVSYSYDEDCRNDETNIYIYMCVCVVYFFYQRPFNILMLFIAPSVTC